MVSVGRWSVIGGEIVPAVTLVAVIVVSVGSMSVAELWGAGEDEIGRAHV